jgi:hypothetical protein
VQTPGFHLRLQPKKKTPPPGEKTPAENFQRRQIRENSKLNENFTFQSGSTIFVFDFKVPMQRNFYLIFYCFSKKYCWSDEE